MAKRIVLISGGNRGIGLEIVKALLESAPTGADDNNGAPYHIYLGSRNLERGQAVAASLPLAHGNTVSAIQLDVTSPSSVSAAVSTVESESGRLDVLINNAGVGINDKDLDEADTMLQMYTINVVGPARLTTAFKPLLLTQPAEPSKKKPIVKRLIHVTSSMGSITSRLDPSFEFYHQPFTGYRCTKAALGMLAACHAVDLGAPEAGGVIVHAFDPGWAATEFGGGDPETLRKYGAVEPRESALACREVVEGKRDHQRNVMVSIRGDTYPW